MKKVIVFLIISCFFSCKREPASFESIEVSYYSGWADGHITIVSKDGTVKRITALNQYGDHSTYSFTEKLDLDKLDSISSYVKKLKTSEIKKSYKEGCVDCPEYAIKIITKEKTIRCMIQGKPIIGNDIAKLCAMISRLEVTKNKDFARSIDYETPNYLIEPVKFIKPSDTATQQLSN